MDHFFAFLLDYAIPVAGVWATGTFLLAAFAPPSLEWLLLWFVGCWALTIMLVKRRISTSAQAVS